MGSYDISAKISGRTRPDEAVMYGTRRDAGSDARLTGSAGSEFKAARQTSLARLERTAQLGAVEHATFDRIGVEHYAAIGPPAMALSHIQRPPANSTWFGFAPVLP